MTDTQTPERITAAPDPEHGWLHATCSDVLLQSEDDTTYVRADLHAAVVAERDQLEEAVNELLIVWQNDGSVGDLDLVKLHATIKSIETNRTELEKHHA